MFSHLLSLIISIKKYHLLCNLINFSIIYIYLQKIYIIIIYFLLSALHNTNSFLLFPPTFSVSFVHIQNETKHYNYHIIYFFYWMYAPFLHSYTMDNYFQMNSIIFVIIVVYSI